MVVILGTFLLIANNTHKHNHYEAKRTLSASEKQRREALRQVDPFIAVRNVTHEASLKKSATTDMQCPNKDWGTTANAVIVGYKHTRTKGCTAKPCLLNVHQGPVKFIPKSRYCTSVSECVTVTVKTKNRLSNCAAMLESLYKFYPETKVIIADELGDALTTTSVADWDSLLKNEEYSPFVSYVRVQPGVGYGRYVGAKLAHTKYILIADDDYIFTKDTNLTNLLTLLEKSDVSIAAGAVNDRYPFDGVFRLWQNSPNSTKAILALYSGAFYEKIPCFPGCYAADIVKNFFLGNRKNILKAGSWDKERLFYEHEDFFFSMRLAGLKVAYCHDVVITHNTKDRGLFALRKKHFKTWQKHLLEKWRLETYFYCDKSSYLKSEKCKASRPFA